MPDVDIDINGHDNTGHATRSASRNVDGLDKRLKAIGKRSATVGQAIAKFTRTVGKFASTASAAASTAGPLALGLAKLAIGTAKVSAGLAPLLGLLPALAAGMGVAKVAALAMAPAFVTATKPIAAAWKTVADHVGAVATKGLPALVKAFIKLDLPVVERDLKRVAAATNIVVIGYGKWATSTAGLSALHTIVGSVAGASTQAAPAVTAMAIALSALAARGAGPAFTRIGDAIIRVANAVTRWADSISTSDMLGVLKRVGDAAETFSNKIRMVKDAIMWLADNPDKVKKMSDALAGFGLALGVATGNPIGIALAAFTLLANHLDTVKAAARSAGDTMTGIWKKLSTDPSLIKIRDSVVEIGRAVKADFIAVWDKIEPALKKAASAAELAWKAFGPMIAGFFANAEVRNGIRVIAIAIGVVAVAIAALAIGPVIAIGALVAALAGAAAWIAGAFVKIITVAMTVIGGTFSVLLTIAARAADALGMHGVADKLRGVQKDIDNFVRNANAMLDSLHDKTITVRVNAYVAGNLAQIERVAGSANDRESRGIGSFRGGLALAAETGGGRVGPPAPVVNASTTVLLDGQVIRSLARTEITTEMGRQAWRASVGRRR